MELDTMRALLAGFVMGAAGAFAQTAVLLAAVVRGFRTGRGLQLRGWEQVRPGLIGVMLANLLVLLWTAAGLGLGALFLWVEREFPTGGPMNFVFSGFVVGSLAVILSGMWGVRPTWLGDVAWASAGGAVVVFGGG